MVLLSISELGNGSFICGVIFLLFALIGLVNAFAAFMMWLNAFLKLLNKKAKSLFVFWSVIIIVTFGWYALFEVIKKIP